MRPYALVMLFVIPFLACKQSKPQTYTDKFKESFVDSCSSDEFRKGSPALAARAKCECIANEVVKGRDDAAVEKMDTSADKTEAANALRAAMAACVK
ncbi:MAG: hypothetical protein JNM27_17100 [Leptospirales bacterium]|nr:hypothetical protein [Leptospirales bacterium]